MNKKQFFQIPLFIITCILALFFYTSINFPLTCKGECNFSIAKGENLKSISDRLKNERFISSSILFQFYVKMKGQEKNIKAGDYPFIEHITIANITEIITDGKLAQNNNSFLILEGETMLEIEENLKEEGLIDESSSLRDWKIEDFLEKKYLDIFSKTSLDIPLEGYLFPDSYNLPQGLEEKEILSIFIDNFVAKAENNLFFDIKKQKRSFYQILIMASLLEKEVREEADKRMVADIIWRRLDTNFPLQIDATICYAEFQSFKKCALTRELFALDSPYNTYLYKGLPPTPINNPGIGSMQAALNPLTNDHWYYMTDRETGRTIFSETFEEHLEARGKYL